MTADHRPNVQRRFAPSRLSKRDVLERGEVFSQFPPRLLTILARRCDVVAMERGTTIATEGHAFESFYVLVAGAVRLTADSGADGTRTSTGDTIGLGSVLTSRRSRVTATALEDTELLRLSSREFWRLATAEPDFLRALTAGLVTMLVDRCPDALAS